MYADMWGVEEETDVAEEAVTGSVDGRRRGACLGSTVLVVRAMSRAGIDDDGRRVERV